MKPSAIQVTANGQSVQLAQQSSIADLLAALGMAGKRVAVEHNRCIVSRSRWDKTRLSEGDRLEIVRAVGGG